jgi:DNA-binding FadR family transcriptional regulator
MATRFHTHIYECIAAQDADGAAAAMTEHLLWSRDQLNESRRRGR